MTKEATDQQSRSLEIVEATITSANICIASGAGVVVELVVETHGLPMIRLIDELLVIARRCDPPPPTLTDAEREASEFPATWQEECADCEAAFARSGVRPTWPDDEPGNIGPMAAAMADEIARLRLTEAERETLEALRDSHEEAAAWGFVCAESADQSRKIAATLRNLLARLGGDQ